MGGAAVDVPGEWAPSGFAGDVWFGVAPLVTAKQSLSPSRFKGRKFFAYCDNMRDSDPARMGQLVFG